MYICVLYNIFQLYDILQKAKLRSEKISHCQGLEGSGWDEQVKHRGFLEQGSENTLCDTIMMNISHCKFIQPNRIHKAKSKP